MTMPVPIPLSFANRDTAIRTVVGEASNQGDAGMAAVAWVIRNRAEWRPTAWWGDHIAAVCSKPYQFTCWGPFLSEPSPGSRNAERIRGLATTDHQYRAAAAILDKVLGGLLADPTGGATHYKVRGTKASWDHAVAAIPPREIGDHDFWRLTPNGICLPFADEAPAPMCEAVAPPVSVTEGSSHG